MVYAHNEMVQRMVPMNRFEKTVPFDYFKQQYTFVERTMGYQMKPNSKQGKEELTLNYQFIAQVTKTVYLKPDI